MKAKSRAPEIKGFHAHVYYDPATKETAARVREGLSRFNVVLGSWHDELVGGWHFGRVNFEVEAPAEIQMSDCNCSICTMSGFLHPIVPKLRLGLFPEKAEQTMLGS